jgi:flagellar assembly protein FliH
VVDALAPLHERQEELAAICASLAATRGDCLRAAEDDMVALCFDTVCHIVGGSVLEPDAVRGLLRAQAARLAEEARVSVHVHPRDAELLRGMDADGQMRYVADPQVALGGCIVRQPGAALDARLETMLAACKEALLAARANASPGARP